MSTTSSMEESMKDLLDRGEVKPSWRDKQFVHFLDLKEAYGREFLARVKEHTESTGFSWADLAKFENERRTCAKMFVDKFGMTYWGTSENRQKYLQEECLADPDTLCKYPERRDEIVRTIMVLLERKAKVYSRMSTEKPKPLIAKPTITSSNATTAPITTPTPRASTQPTATSSTPQKCPTSNPNLNSKSKRKQSTVLPKETDEDYTELQSSSEKPIYKLPRTRAISNAIRPFKSFLTETESEAELEPTFKKTQKPSQSKKKLNPHHHQQQQQNPIHHTNPSTEETPRPPKVKKSSLLAPPPPPPMGTLIHKNTPSSSTTTPTPSNTKTMTASSANYAPTTTFLTTATNQPGMAPVWIPYEEFTSTAAFLDYMADQCNLVEWNPTAQLSREDTGLFASSSPANSVIAASVRFDWSDFEIRVRQGHNEDWVIVQRELVRAWRGEAAAVAAVAAGEGEMEAREFRIRVLLHVLG
ncbi:hypothetical protein BO94DRAFT_541792 [Aspergillus sclerotioniger CBS 115572]|uniref:Uncharacterized protein n=1 Tax=Aspergillus sclerotioniger CBS 115572 TaxID=1450535 RepID=A0A317XAQ5_9EURO|nr:hypothetical protein BO94DRAFT_541792 [Aspergillus sclerotioniger CBS 115572]PWY95676.1 hypothetical protein BO94DRAFT_541792 [Aspergillus sclerotioniger CBS 115572]